MAVQSLTTPSPPTSPRRSPRLGLLPTRKRARVSDSDQQLAPSSSKLQLTPDPSPRWIRANKRQKVLDDPSLASPPPTTTPNANGSTRAGKRKSLTPHDHHELGSHHIVRKKRKENIVNDAPTANATTSSLKISVTQDTRQGGGNNNTGQSQSLKLTRNTRSMTRTMKKPSPDVQARVDSPPPPDSTTRSHVFTAKPILPPTPASSSTIPSPSITTDTKSAIPTYDVGSTTTITGVITNDAQPSSIPSSPTPNCSSPDSTPPPLSKSPLEISTSLIMPLPISISSLAMSFMNVPLSMPSNLAFMNMPLSMPLSLPLNIPISTDISTTLAPSESELGFGFQPQEEFSSTGPEEGQGKGNGDDGKGSGEGGHAFPSTPPLLTPARPTTNESTATRSSSDIFLDCPPSPPPPPPQSCTPCLNPTSNTPTPTRTPPRLAISTCLPDQSPPTSTSTTTSPTSYSFINSTSPTHSSPLKLICFPSLPVPQQQHERRMKEWPMNMADDQRQTERALEQEMGMDLSLSFRNSSTGQGDELRLAQQELEEQRSPLLDPAPQPSSSQPPDSYPQLAPPLPSCPPSPACCSSSSSSASSSSSSRQYHKKVEYQHHQIPEWTPKLDKERNLWKLACKIRVWEITKRYTPDTIRTVVAQEAHDYYSAHGFPLGYGSVPSRSRKRRWRKIPTATAGSDTDCASSSMVSTPSLSPPSPRDDEFMNEETYSFELMDDDEDMEGSISGVGLVGGLRSMEDEWRYEGFEDDEFEEDDEDEDEDEDYDDLYEDDDDDDDEVDDEVVEGDGDRTKMSGNRKKKGDVSFIAGEDQDQDPDAEGEMEIDIEPFQDPSFNAELSSPTSPTSSSSTSSKSKSKSKSNSGVGDEPQSYVSSFYIPTIPPVSPHVQHMMQMQQQQQREEEARAALAPSLDSSSNPLSPSSEGTPISTFDAVDHSASPPSNNESNHTPMQIHLPPAPHHPHHYHSSQLIQFTSNILPLPPPRLDSVRVFILRQSEMGGLKTTGRGTPADRKRGAIWCGVQVGGGRGQEVGMTGGNNNNNNKRGFDDGKSESESESDEESGGEEDEGGKRGRPRLRLMLSDHDGPRSGGNREGEGGGETGLRHKPSSSTSTTSTTTFVATDQTWDAFLASLDDKNQHQQQPPQQQQQGEVGSFDSSVIAADSDTIITHGQQLLLDGHLFSNQHQLHHQLHRERDSPIPPSLTTTTTTAITRRLGPTLSSTSSSSLEGSSGMFMFDHEEDDEGEDSTSRWFGGDDDEGGGGRSSSSSGLVVVVGSSPSSASASASSTGTCPSDALAMEGFNFPDGSSTLSYALG